MTKEGKGNKKTDNQVTTGKKTVTSANVATVTKMKAKVPTKPKVQNDLDENLVEEAVKGLLAYEAKKSIQENSSSLLDHYAKPILVQVQSPSLESISYFSLYPFLPLDSIKESNSIIGLTSNSY
jgi:hypothetical protein